MTSFKQRLGQEGEDYAANFLVEAGLIIIKRNYRCPKGEIDIIARDQQDLVFVEVRTRSSEVRGWGEESITGLKRRRLQSIVSYFLLEQGYRAWPRMRFDLVALRWQDEIHSCNWLKAIF
ncbi:MAG: YraN family protein [Desulfitobacteriaceae bacterium]|nr:YraN family protein [Desulfitobacteriaceae bacterium]MDD4346383.1 YraN family protein [Desulfitobacteriaceae bacterium]MDD4400936.1 YraN family protein [Desulfitobacteriaceae bacterium]